jgi:hypothetical protein
MLKRVATFVAKLGLLYLLFLIVWADIVLMMVTVPRLILDMQPFLQVSGLVLVVATALSAKAKSRSPLLWATFCLAYTSVFVFFSHYAFALFLFLFIAGAVSFLYRNRFTEPLLVLLPIISGAWLFLTLIYSSYFVGWAYYVTGQKDLFASLHQGFASLNVGYLYIGNVLPFMVLYFLAKRGHVKLYAIYRALSPNPSVNTDAPR